MCGRTDCKVQIPRAPSHGSWGFCRNVKVREASSWIACLSTQITVASKRALSAPLNQATDTANRCVEGGKGTGRGIR